MRLSNLFSLTLRDNPTEAETTNHQLLLRAGYIRQQAAGIFIDLPLGFRTMQRIENVFREEIDSLGGQELLLPVVHSADVWKETGRWYENGAELSRFKDRAGRDMVIAAGQEEIAASLARDLVRSHRQLPVLIYQAHERWRDDPRPRGGLLHTRQSRVFECYGLTADAESLRRQFDAVTEAFKRTLDRCGLPVTTVESDSDVRGAAASQDLVYLTPLGEETILSCNTCGYSANQRAARPSMPEAEPEEARAMEKIPTPHTATIEDLANLLGVPRSRTAKAVFLTGIAGESAEPEPVLIFAVVRGDREVSEAKLARLLCARELKPAQDAEIRAVGAVPGYASPVGVPHQAGLRVVVDELVTRSPNLVAGANEEGYHLLNVNYGRDYTADLTADISAAREGDACPRCGGVLSVFSGTAVGNLCQVGDRMTTALGAAYLDENRQSQPVWLGSYTINVDRVLGCLVEERHDDHGLVWPAATAPYPIHLVRLGSKDGSTEALAEKLYQDLCGMKLEPLFDDRLDSPGVKFNDADLIGLPLRLTVSERALKQGGVEFKHRAGGEAFVVPLEGVISRVQEELEKMRL